MRVVLVEAGRHPTFVDLRHDLDAMHEAVGGYIQAIYPFDDPVGLVCDEDALAKPEQKWNRVVDEYTAIKGPFFICGLGEEDFTDLSDELAEKYLGRFWMPEDFIIMDGHLKVIRYDDGTEPPRKESWAWRR